MLSLAPNIYLAPIEDRAVVLDLGADRYFALGPRLASAVLRLLQEPECPARDARLAEARSVLVQRGVLTDEPQRRTYQRPETSRPRSTLWPAMSAAQNAAGRTGGLSAFAVLFTLAQVWCSLRLHPFHATLAWVRRQGARPVAARSREAVLTEFFAARPWFLARPICRLDALALHLLLRRNGHDTRLVIGVKLEPFGAHCWVQYGDQAINEPHEVVATFEPILVIGEGG